MVHEWPSQACIKKEQDSFTGSHQLPSGKRLRNYWKSPFLMGKLTISMTIFNSYVKLLEGIFNWRALYWHKSRVTLFPTSTLKFFKCKRPANFAQDKIEDWKQNWSPMLGTMINNHVVPQSFWSKVNKLNTSPTLPEIGCTQTQIHPTNWRCVASRAQRCVSCFSQSQNLSFLTSNVLDTFPPPPGFQVPVGVENGFCMSL